MSTPRTHEPDPVLEAICAEADADPDTLGLILGGSRGANVADHESDYDIEWVLSDEAHDARAAPRRKKQTRNDDTHLDLVYTCPRELAALAARPDWRNPGYASARVLVDKTGEVAREVAREVAAIAALPPDKAEADVPAWFDAYLNALYRSLKAWRRNNELGARLQAAESAMHLARCLFSLERRWTPYHDRLSAQLDTLNEAQNWPPGYLRNALLRLVSTGDPAFQQEFAARVIALLRERGHGGVVDAWEGEIERVLVFRFAS